MMYRTIPAELLKAELDTHWIIVEQDEPSENGPLKDAEQSMRYILSLFI